jgi:dihydrofolate reductase
MKISCIVAICKNNVIGKNNTMPWHIPADLKYFKKITSGHCIILGRKNFESIGKALPNRTNIVLTRQKDFYHSSVFNISSIENALKIAYDLGEEEVFIVGGAEIYDQTIKFWDKLYLTEIQNEFEGDTFFPDIDYSEWRLIQEIKKDISEDNPYDLVFKVFERIIP